MRTFDFPATRLAAGMDNRVHRAPAFRGNVPGIALDQEHRPRGRIVKGRIQTQMVMVCVIRLGTDNRQGGQNAGEWPGFLDRVGKR